MVDCNDCPFKDQIEKNTGDIEHLKKEYVEQDKQSAVFRTEIRQQYLTILSTIKEHGKDTRNNTEKIIELEKKEILNNHKTESNSDWIKNLTFGKVAGIILVLLTIAATFSTIAESFIK